MPKKYFFDFIRGYFDGDGNVWAGEVHKKRKTSHTMLQVGFTSCSGLFLKALHDRLQELGIRGGSFYCKKSAFCIKYSTSDSLTLYNFMYSSLESELFLPRKKRVFENFIHLNT